MAVLECSSERCCKEAHSAVLVSAKRAENNQQSGMQSDCHKMANWLLYSSQLPAHWGQFDKNSTHLKE